MNLDMTMFHQAFFEEAADLLTDFEDLLLHLEETPEDKELLNTIFRCAHSIKGGSATFGFHDIAHFTHGLETLLDRLRNGQVQVEPVLTQLLLESLDQMKALLAVARGEQSAARDSAPLILRIEAAIAGSDSGAPIGANTLTSAANIADPAANQGEAQLEMQRYHLRFVPGAEVLKQGTDPGWLLARLASASEIHSIVCDLDCLPPLTEMDPEACYFRWDIDFDSDWSEGDLIDIFEFIADESEIVLTAEAKVPPAAGCAGIVTALSDQPVKAASLPTSAIPAALLTLSTARAVETPGATVSAMGAKAEAHTLRVSTEKVDKLMNLVGELVINQSMLNEVVQGFTMAKLPRLQEAVAEMERASRELQERVMAVRMLPIKHAFGRFPRLVRDLAGSCGKRIELKTTGEETELDKTVIESIGDPLTHLIRNSIDHGLETPEERRAAGKGEIGTVALNAFHEGGNIVIEVSDDGRGLNRERILRKAIDRGLLSETDAPTDEALYSFIFHPGFSTAAEVTDLSGRGVGMDIVKQAVQALGGSITLSSTPGVGTRFRIRLPLTMAILEGLSLRVGQEVYILPLTSIVESIRPRTGDVRRIAGQSEVAMVRGEVLPILRMYQKFGAVTEITDPTQGLLVIVEYDGRKVALLVDELIGQSQVVIKSLESNYRKVDGIAGATILGDGRVALIIDVPGLLGTNHTANAMFAAA